MPVRVGGEFGEGGWKSNGGAQGGGSYGNPGGGAPQNRPVIDDEQLKRMLSQNKPGFFQANASRIVTLTLIALNVVVYLIEVLLSGGSFDVSLRTLVNMGAMYVPAVQSAADVYRFVTPMFLHMDIMHLMFNMVALYSVGELLERVLGRWNFLLLYFVAGITGNAVSYMADILTGSLGTVSAGASTSVFGLFVAVALLGVLIKGNRGFFRQYSKGMLSVIAINVVYTLLVPSISVSGHLGGALGGLIAMFMVPSKNLRVPKVVRVAVSVLWVVALVFMLVSTGIFAS